MARTAKKWQRARRPEQKEERRAAILAAAGELLDSEGLEGTGLNAIARASGISKPNLYRYFESREAVLLQLLLEEHRGWTRAYKRRLVKLRGSSDVDSIAKSFADTIAGRSRYCILIAALAGVLEHNVGLETVIEFKRELNDANLALVPAFQEALPSLTAEQAYAALAALLMAASGMWPHCHPAPVVQEALAQPEFASMRFDFKSMVREHATALLLGLLTRAD